MSRFDLNKIEDFATLTMSRTTELLNAFARDQTVWAISEGAYTGGRKGARRVLFHVFKSKSDYQAGLPRITDTSGRRLARFSTPYVDGQTTEDMGRKAESFDIEVIFHGPGYKAGMNRFMIELHDPIPGTLEHPVRGTVRAKLADVTIEHAAETKQAALVRVRLEEHNYESAAFSEITTYRTPKSALQNMLKAIQAIQAAIAAVQQIRGAIASLVNNLKAMLRELLSFAVNLAADAASSFGLRGVDIASVLSLAVGGLLAPATLAGITAGGVNTSASFGSSPTTSQTAGVGGLATTEGGFIRVSTRFTTVVAPTDPFANLPIDLLSDIARTAIELTQLSRRNETMRQMSNEIAASVDAAIVVSKTAGAASLGRSAAALQNLLQAKMASLQSCAAMADLIRSGSANGRPSIINYTTPREMSIREAAFLNGLTPQDGADIALLNPSLESTNIIAKGTVLKVPAFV